MSQAADFLRRLPLFAALGDAALAAVAERTVVRPVPSGTLLFREGHANLFNFGAGVNYWLSARWGLKFEFRDHVMREDWSRTTIHYWGVRIGVAIRSRS